MNSNLLMIIKKELLRVFTDRRLVFTSFILPALSIAIIYSVMGTMLGNMFEDIEEHVPDVYIQNAPQGFEALLQDVQWKDRMNVHKVPSEEDITPIKDQIRTGDVDLLVTFENGFEDAVEAYKTEEQAPEVRTYYNASEDYSSQARFDLFGNIFEQYEQQLLGNRLGDIRYANVFDIDRENTEANIVDERKATGKGLGMLLPMLISIFLFAGAMGIGMDMIAGEKERGTMATMLVTPVKRETIAFGKIVSLGIIAFISAGSSFLGILLSMPFASNIIAGGNENVNLAALQFGFSEYAQLILLMISLVAIYVGLICLLSIMANTVKEAGSYVVPVYMVVMLSGFLNMFTSETPEVWQYGVPIYGGVVGIRSLLMFELTWEHVLLVLASSALVTGVLIVLIKRMFNSEKVMFNG